MSDKIIDDAESFQSLAGKILVATPYMMNNSIFHKSLIYVVSHNADGAMGLMLNHVINYVDFKLFFDIKQPTSEINETIPVYLGGPIESSRGFFIHSTDYAGNLVINDENSVAISATSKVAQDISNGTGPKNRMFILGYTGWHAGQLEKEMLDNLWIISNYSQELVFSCEPSEKWSSALKLLRIDEHHFISERASA